MENLIFLFYNFKNDNLESRKIKYSFIFAILNHYELV